MVFAACYKFVSGCMTLGVEQTYNKGVRVDGKSMVSLQNLARNLFHELRFLLWLQCLQGALL